MKSACRWAFYLAAAAALLVAVFEVALRMLVVTHPQSGVDIFGRIALLPYMPGEINARAVVSESELATYVVRDPELGWTLKQNGRGSIYEANHAGLRGRNDEVVERQAPVGKVRIAVYGDSFTHGDEVPLEGTWPYMLGQRVSQLDVLNFGVPGYGMDQAYLRFKRDGVRFDAQIHMLCVWPEDIIRNLNVIRFYLTPAGGLSTSKPRFLLGADDLSLTAINLPTMTDHEFVDTVLGNAVHPVMRYDRWYDVDDASPEWLERPHTLRTIVGVVRAYQRKKERQVEYLQTTSEANRLAVAIARDFVANVKASGGVPILTIIPARDFLDQHAVENGWPLVSLLRAAGIKVIDLGPALARASQTEGLQALFLPSGHMTTLGNKLIAKAIADQLPAIEPALAH